MARRNNNAKRGRPSKKDGDINRRSGRNRREDWDDSKPRGGRADAKNFENDLSWYTRYPNLLQAAASLPFPVRPGMFVPMGKANDPTDNTRVFGTPTYRVPGVMVLDWVPSMGKSNSVMDPASVVAKEVYSRVRKAYAGTLSVDAPDFVMYFGALDSIFAYIAALKRVYRLLNAWTPENHVLPDTVLRALGFASDVIVGLRAHRTQLWQYINELVLQARKFTCPAVFDYFNRHYWMSDNVYTDGSSINSQFYVFNLIGCYSYAQVKTPQGVDAAGLTLSPTPWIELANPQSATTLTVDFLYNFGSALITNLSGWDDSYTISGYLARAFDGAPTFIVDEIPLDQPFNPVYAEEVLTQIENSRTLPGLEYNITNDNASLLFGDASFTKVLQDPTTNAVITSTTYKVSLSSFDSGLIKSGMIEVNPVMSLRTDTPSAGDVVIASRLMSAWKLVSATTSDLTITADVGSEVPVRWRIFGCDQNVNKAYIPYPSVDGYFDAVSGTDYGKSPASMADLLNVEQFDWHPFMQFGFAIGTDTQASLNVIIRGDVHNINSVLPDVLEQIHRVCLYSEFNSFSIDSK